MAVKIPLEMADGIRVRSLEELRDHFDLATLLTYYDNGRLIKWLKDYYYDDEAKNIIALDSASLNFKKDLCDILGIYCSKHELNLVDLDYIEDKNKRLEHLKKYTADATILESVDYVAFTQEELLDLLKYGCNQIYLCSERFSIPEQAHGTLFIGINDPQIDVPPGFCHRSIRFQNIHRGIEDILQLIEAESLFLDYKLDEAFAIFKVLAEKGIGRAIYFMGQYYLDGYGSTKADDKLYVKWRRAGQNTGDILASLNVAFAYEENSPERERLVKQWFDPLLQLAESGDVFAQDELASLYCGEKGIGEDKDKEMYWSKKAAEQGSWIAAVNVGNIYEYYYEDYENAIIWYRKAAEQGYDYAQYMLGECYYYGEGVEQDYVSAVHWYRKAAEQDYDDAQYSLGLCYELGNGVDINVDTAIEWYEKADKSGHSEASKKLRQYMFMKMADRLNDLQKVLSDFEENERQREGRKY